MALYEAGDSLDAFLWRHVDGRPIVNHWRRIEEVPAFTPTAQALAKALQRQGFRFVGPTVIYSLMQAIGMVNDHLIDCPRHAALAGGA
ncbi:MAG: DNA-3-methyladenine glycosylase I [Rhodocyclaceae bacterium]|nr:DNA-3-methyladenine glycosylase I [Rhodocyclaceae bacterium]